ncbi:MAG: hypothetical protein WCG27_01170 [Pseudomonadota bacterium]
MRPQQFLICFLLATIMAGTLVSCMESKNRISAAPITGSNGYNMYGNTGCSNSNTWYQTPGTAPCSGWSMPGNWNQNNWPPNQYGWYPPSGYTQPAWWPGYIVYPTPIPTPTMPPRPTITLSPTPTCGDGTGNFTTLSSIITGFKMGGIFWSSATDPRLSGAAAQNLFRTDVRFQVKVKPLTAPNQYTLTYDSRSCPYRPDMPYRKFKGTLRLINSGGNTQDQEFETGPMCWSSIINFSQLPALLPSGGNPYTLQVINLRWDGDCNQLYQYNGSTDSTICPPQYSEVPHGTTTATALKDCVQFKLQISVDGQDVLPL